MLSIIVLFLSVGGIYTVIRTKAQTTVEELGDRYILIGPYNEHLVRTEVETSKPQDPAIAEAIEKMANQGIRVIHGHWLIEGYPRVILFDIGSAAYKLNEWKHEFYEATNIGRKRLLESLTKVHFFRVR